MSSPTIIVPNQPGIIGATIYNPASFTTVTTTSSTLAAIDGTNLTLTITVPSSGNIMVILSSIVRCPTGANQYIWAIGNPTIVSNEQAVGYSEVTGNLTNATIPFYITGLTPGSMTLTWLHSVQGGATGLIGYGGNSSSPFGAASIICYAA